MKEKQRKLGTESHLIVRNEVGGKVKVSIYSDLLTAVAALKNVPVSRSNILFPHSNFIPYL